MRTLLILFFIFFCSATLLANDSTDLQVFKSANLLYEEGDYKEATERYQRLLDKGYISDDLHYNLANSYFKTEDIAPAILHYERALKINPRNEDAINNLRIANEKTVDKIEQVPVLFFYRWYKNAVNLFHVDTWAKITIALLFLGLFCFTLYLLSQTIRIKKLAFYSFSLALILGLISWFMAAQQERLLKTKEYAIIMNPTVTISSSPSEGSSQLFVLHEGSKVKIKEEIDEWYRVALPNGNEGWVEKTELEAI